MLRLLVRVTLAAVASCSSLDKLTQPQGSDPRPESELNYPGYVDVDVGFGVISNTRSGDNNFAQQLALPGGYGFYNGEEGGIQDTDGSLFFGVSLNLNAYKVLYDQRSKQEAVR